MTFLTSCDKFSFTKKQPLQVLDTIVDFSSVDKYPSFPACDSIIDRDKKAICFRETIHATINEELQKHHFQIKDSINETIFLDILINAKGRFILDTIKSSENIRKQLPELDSILRTNINQLPEIISANKMGIPVTTKYQLPIKILLKE